MRAARRWCERRGAADFWWWALPEFDEVPPYLAHFAVSRLLFLLVLGHVGAALWHHFVKRDGLIGRMRLG